LEALGPKLPPKILYHLTHPHQIWFIDHMHLLTLPDGKKVYSLIVLDGWSRVLLSQEICQTKGAQAGGGLGIAKPPSALRRA